MLHRDGDGETTVFQNLKVGLGVVSPQLPKRGRKTVGSFRPSCPLILLHNAAVILV